MRGHSFVFFFEYTLGEVIKSMEMPAAYAVICRKTVLFARIWHKNRNFLRYKLLDSLKYRCSYKTGYIDSKNSIFGGFNKKSYH